MDQSFELAIGSDITEIPTVSARLEEVMIASGFSAESVLDTQLAVEEAITNVVVHGYKKTGYQINLSCRAAPDHIEVQITDSAPQFNPLLIPEPDTDSDVSERQIGGLGIYLVRQVMDNISYRFENGKNILTLTKNKTG
jgi:serine/threonine-protein kinase RsbW